MSYNPQKDAIVIAEPLGATGFAIDARSLFLDEVNLVRRAYASLDEVKEHFDTEFKRTGKFIVYVNSTGVLNSDGTFTGGEDKAYEWRGGVADEDLVLVLEKGEAFTYADFTPEEIEGLKQPAIEAANIADTATVNANTATSQANTATNNANTATSEANTAADNANDKATLANNAANNANDKASLANTATNNANIATTNADNAATNANNKATLAQTAANNADTATANTNTARDNANTAASSANTATSNANTATSAANTATSNANTATSEANDARDEALAAAIVANGARGWQPEYGLESDGAEREVQKLIRWVGGTGSTPIDYIGKYIGSTGFVDTKAEATNVKGKKAIISSTSITSNVIATGAKTFILVTPIDLVQGQVAKAYSLADPTNYVLGYITNLSPFTINVSEIGGVGTKTDWVITLAAFKGTTGITTPNINSLKLAGRSTGGLGAVEELNPYGLYINSGNVFNGSYGVSEGYAIASMNNPSGGLMLDWGLAQTGALCIKLPSNTVSTLLIKGSIWSTGANLSGSFIISAYPTNMTGSTTAIFIGGVSYPVRWYTNGADNYIYIGDTTTVWGEKTIILDNIQASLSNPFLFASGWVMTFETSFLGTQRAYRTAEQTLPNPGLNYSMTGYNAASGTETDVTNATSPIQAFQNIEKKLGNRYTKPQSDVRYFPSTVYTNAGTGILLKTDIATTTNINVIVKLIGNGASGSNPIDITIQLLQNAAGVISRTNAISLGHSFPIYAFSLSGFLHIWFNHAISCSIGVNIYNSGGFNQPFIYHSFVATEEVKPTTGVTNEVLITPKKALLNDISGLTLVNDKLFNGVERYADNTTQKVVLVSNIADGLFRTGNATDTGAIKIALPTAAFGSGYQPVIKGLIYFYDALLATNRSCEFMITANTGSFGNGASAVFIGANAPKFPVRWYLDADGTTRYIAIGELTQDWSYLSFAITDVLNGINGATLASTASGYNISLITAFTGTIQQLRTETLPKPGLSNTALRGLTLQNDILHNAVQSGIAGTPTNIITALNVNNGRLAVNTTTTGAIKIPFPAGAVNSFYTIYGYIKSYGIITHFAISANPTGMTGLTSATISGSSPVDLTVRFFADGTSPYIAIGQLAQNWSYLQVAITGVVNSFSNATLANTTEGWDVSLITSFTGTQESIITNSNARVIPNLNQPVSDYVAASGVDTPLTNAMSPLQMFQNLQKQNDNRYTKTESDGRYPTLPTLGATSASIIVADARGSSPLPGTDRQKGVWFEFKNSSDIGLALGGPNSAVTTFIPWTDNTGNNNLAYRLASSAGNIWFQSYASGAWGTWYRILDSRGSSANILLGDGTYQALSTLPAFTATKLLTARNINGVAFDGTANITIADATKIPTSEKGANNGVATLDSGGKIPSSQLPALAITDTFPVASQADMLALTAQVGDVAIRSDINKTFILRIEPATTLGNWSELLNPTDAVTSVAGKTGVVTLVKADVGLGSVDDTPDTAKPVSTAQAASIATKAPIRYEAITAVGSNITLALTDENDYLRISGTRNITVPPNSTVAFPIGARIDFIALSSAVATFVEGAGVTITKKTDLILTGFGACTLIKTDTDAWDLIGNN